MRKFLIKVSGQQFEVEVEEVKSAPVAKTASQSSVSAPAPTVASETKAGSAAVNGSAKVSAPMPGNILRINVKVGDIVKKGQALLILEAMKMENEISAPANGKVVEIKTAVGESVAANQLLVVLE